MKGLPLIFRVPVPSSAEPPTADSFDPHGCAVEALDRTASPDTIFEYLGGSVLPMAVSPTGADSEPIDLVMMVSSVTKGRTGLGGLPASIYITMYDYRQPEQGQEEWPVVVTTVQYAPEGSSNYAV